MCKWGWDLKSFQIIPPKKCIENSCIDASFAILPFALTFDLRTLKCKFIYLSLQKCV